MSSYVPSLLISLWGFVPVVFCCWGYCGLGVWVCGLVLSVFIWLFWSGAVIAYDSCWWVVVYSFVVGDCAVALFLLGLLVIWFDCISGLVGGVYLDSLWVLCDFNSADGLGLY